MLLVRSPRPPAGRRLLVDSRVEQPASGATPADSQPDTSDTTPRRQVARHPKFEHHNLNQPPTKTTNIDVTSSLSKHTLAGTATSMAQHQAFSPCRQVSHGGFHAVTLSLSTPRSRRRAGTLAPSCLTFIGAAPAAAAQRRLMAALVPGQTSCDCQFWCGMAPVRDILSRSCCPCGRILERCVLPCGVLAACRHARRSPGHQDLQVYV